MIRYDPIPLRVAAVAAALVACLLSGSAQAELSRTARAPAALGKAFGFYAGQLARLDRVERAHPSLASQVAVARLQFTQAFPDIEANARRTMANWAGSDAEAASTLDQIKGGLSKILEREPIDLESSRAFLDAVVARSKGEGIPEDILQYLLALAFMDSPGREMSSGWRKSYNSKGDPKAKGVTVLLKTPTSYKREEPERPNIVAKWGSEGGYGLGSIMLMVLASDPKPPTRKDIEADIQRGQNGDIWKSYSSFGKVKSLKSFSQELTSGVIIDYDSVMERAGEQVASSVQMYMLYLPGKLVAIQCGVFGGLQMVNELRTRLERNSVVCRQVVSSLVLPQQYPGGE